MQIVYITNRPDMMCDTIRHVRKFMSFIDDVVIFCPAKQIAHLAGEIEDARIIDEMELVRGREEAFASAAANASENHVSINYMLRSGLAHHPAVKNEFIMSDDDFRPLVPIGADYFVSSSGVYNAFFMTSIEHYVGFISQKYDPNPRNTPFHNLHRDMLRLFKSLGLPSLMYAVHMPQIVNKDIWRESVEFFAPYAGNLSLGEWSTYFNFGQSKYPELFSNKLYEVMNWPHLDFALASPHNYTFELIYQEDTISCPYSEGEVFSGLPKYFTEKQEKINREKISRYKRKQMDHYSGTRTFEGRDIRMNDGCSRGSNGVLCMGKEGACVTYGPYAKLVEGSYRAILRFSVKQASSDIFFRIDMCGNAGGETILSSTSIDRTNSVARGDGGHVAEVEFTLSTFFPDVELRTFMAADGDIYNLESIEFAPVVAEAELPELPAQRMSLARRLGGPVRSLFARSERPKVQPAAEPRRTGPSAAPSARPAPEPRRQRAAAIRPEVRPEERAAAPAKAPAPQPKMIAEPVVRSEPLAPRRRAASPKGLHLSLVSACYNVELYLERFLDSIFSQEGDFDRFEVILVDDGSTDRTGAIAQAWQERFPDHIRYVYQENAGVCAARNAGLELATGTWIGFPDPDDFISKDFFSKMLAETNQKHGKPLLAVVANMLFYHEESDSFADTHPLRFRFQNGTARSISGEMNEFIHLTTNNTWFDRASLCESQFLYSLNVKPSFEDAHLINRLFTRFPNRTVSFLPGPTYFYRKRNEKTSILDGARSKPEWYLDQIEHGYLDLLKFATSSGRRAPIHVQRTCLYDMVWRFRYLVDHSEYAGFLSPEQKTRFLELTREVFAYIDPEVISDFNLAGCTEEHKVALLALYKNARREKHTVYVEQIDAASGIAQFSYHVGGEDDFTIDVEVNGKPVAPIWPSQRLADFMGQTYFRRRYFWVPMNDGDDICFLFEGAPCNIRRQGRTIGDEANWLKLRNAVAPATARITDPEIRRLRDYVIANREVYRDCHVLMDREDKADDNAEHLYRHLMKTGRAGNAWFVLRRNSLDWDRLEAEGFKLLEFGSDDHIAAQMNAATVISSHIDHFILWPIEKRHFADLARYKFVFLQHGVTTNDLSLWLNTKPIRLFITATPDEARSIEAPESKYIFSEREVLRSGFPRHDALLRTAEETPQDSILIMPTWRKYLTDETARDGMQRGKVADFVDSDYARNWGAVLRDPRLHEMADRHGKKVVFLPHPNMAMYLDEMGVPDWVERIDIRDGISYQEHFARAAVALTCFSSAASEVAFLQRPVVYFHFDTDAVFSGGHVYGQGYFSFKRDGFGPVAETPHDVFKALSAALEGKEDPVYAERRARAFPFRDGGCCERVWQAVERLTDRRRRFPMPVGVTAIGEARHDGGEEAEFLPQCTCPQSSLDAA